MTMAARAIVTRRATTSKPATKPARKPLTAYQRNQRSARTTKILSGKITRENQRSATTQQNQREVLRTEQAGERIQQREASILHRYREGIGIRRSERLQKGLIEEPAVGAVKPAVNSVILLVVTAFSLIILYALVTHSEGLSGFLSNLSNGIATFSQTGPLFKTTPKG